MLKVTVAKPFQPLLSVTLMTTVKVPAVVGVPLRAPFEAIVMPAGITLVLGTENVTVPDPPLTVKGFGAGAVASATLMVAAMGAVVTVGLFTTHTLTPLGWLPMDPEVTTMGSLMGTVLPTVP